MKEVYCKLFWVLVILSYIFGYSNCNFQLIMRFMELNPNFPFTDAQSVTVLMAIARNLDFTLSPLERIIFYVFASAIDCIWIQRKSQIAFLLRR